MCKSLEVSVLTGLYSYAISFYLYKRNIGYDRAAALILVVFSTIQWLEGILWGNLYNLPINKLATALLPIVLGAEFLAALYGASLFTKVTTLEVILYIGAFFVLIYLWSQSSNGYTSVDPKTGSLLWGGSSISYIGRFAFIILLLWPLLRLAHKSRAFWLIILSTCFTFFWSFRYGATFGSNWCWLANVNAVIWLFSPYIG